jgi:hypothetical protein
LNIRTASQSVFLLPLLESLNYLAICTLPVKRGIYSLLASHHAMVVSFNGGKAITPGKRSSTNLLE